MITTGRGQASGFRYAVASPHHLTSVTAATILDDGGNAIDAAVAANAVQGTVAPETCGIGGDLFALVWVPGTDAPLALNASGPAGSGVSAQALRDLGLNEIPGDHPAAVSIPGAVGGWASLVDRLGSRPLDTLLAPAIDLAVGGFPASTELSRAFTARADRLSGQTSAESLYPNGAPPSPGDRITRPLLAETLERIASDGADGFYRGPVAEDIVAATNGGISLEDLAAYRPDWVEPATTDVLGRTGWTIGPNSQGYVTLAALRLFELSGATFDPADPESHHRLVEAYRIVAAERDDLVADPDLAPLSPADLLDDERLELLAAGIGDRAGDHRLPSRRPGGTAFLCVVDASGMAVSFIQSNYRGIGTNIGAGRSGFILHDRGSGATLEPGHPNELAPGRRPFHTLAPTLWSSGDRPTLVLGTRGGHQQPQLLAQVAAHLFAGDEPWEAQARPRWTIPDAGVDGGLRLEPGFDDAIVEGLGARGHEAEVTTMPTGGWGPVSLITLGAGGLLTAAADPRVDTAMAMAR